MPRTVLLLLQCPDSLLATSIDSCIYTYMRAYTDYHRSHRMHAVLLSPIMQRLFIPLCLFLRLGMPLKIPRPVCLPAVCWAALPCILAMKPTVFIVDRQTAALREISITYLQP